MKKNILYLIMQIIVLFVIVPTCIGLTLLMFGSQYNGGPIIFNKYLDFYCLCIVLSIPFAYIYAICVMYHTKFEEVK
jgi:hypothetical protein